MTFFFSRNRLSCCHDKWRRFHYSCRF